MKKAFVAIFSALAVFSATAGPDSAPKPTADLEQGIALSPLLLDAAYEALAPGHGLIYRRAHATEISYALQHPLHDEKSWDKAVSEPQCRAFWKNARLSHARVVEHFTLPDFHTNLEIDHAVIAGGVALGTAAQALQHVSEKLGEGGEDLNPLCTALDTALVKATAVALKYPATSVEYLDLAKLSVAALAFAMPALIDAQQWALRK